MKVQAVAPDSSNTALTTAADADLSISLKRRRLSLECAEGGTLAMYLRSVVFVSSLRLASLNQEQLIN